MLLNFGGAMKLAVNFSEILVALLKKYPELPVDFIKVPTIVKFPEGWDQFNLGSQYRNLLPHIIQDGILSLGNPDNLQQYNKETIQKILELTKPPHLSTHLRAGAEYFPEFNEFLHGYDVKLEKALIDRFVNVIKLIQEQIKIPLLVENYPYYSWWTNYRLGSEPSFINRICNEADCGFLLDLAHAQVSAWHMKTDILKYLSLLPLERVKEIHLGGVRQAEYGGLWDAHTALASDDYQLLQFILNETKPDIITLEYGGFPDRQLNLKGSYELCPRNNVNELYEMIYQILSF